MDVRNLQKLRYGFIPQSSHAVSVPTVSACCPIARPSGVTPEPHQDPDKYDYNGLSISDVQFLGSFRHSDRLHRSDLLAAEHSRGAKLNAYVKENGTDKFISNYKY